LRELVARLIASETRVGNAGTRISARLGASETKGNFSETTVPAGFAVVEKLRVHLGVFMGTLGFRTLLARALALAGTEAPWLRALHIKADGSLEGLEQIERDAQVGPKELAEGRVLLIAHLLGLLATFIGENLTLQLVREIWPKVSFNDLDIDRRGLKEQ